MIANKTDPIALRVHSDKCSTLSQLQTQSAGRYKNFEVTSSEVVKPTVTRKAETATPTEYCNNRTKRYADIGTQTEEWGSVPAKSTALTQSEPASTNSRNVRVAEGSELNQREPASNNALSVESEQSEQSEQPEQPEQKPGKPINVYHKITLGDRLIATLKSVTAILGTPIKLMGNIAVFFVKPLQAYLIIPAYEGLLYVVWPEKYEARELEKKSVAEKAKNDKEWANRQEFEKVCLRAAMENNPEVYNKFLSVPIAKHFGVTGKEAFNEITRQQAYTPFKMEFKKKMEKGNLELKVREKIERKVDPDTGENYDMIPTRVVTVATDEDRAAVIVEGNSLDADDAEVAKRLGNDPELAEKVEEYNKAKEEYEQKLAAYDKEMVSFNKVKEQADKNGEPFDLEEPVHPVLPVEPLFKCTDPNVIHAYNLQSEKHYENSRANLEFKKRSIDESIEELRLEMEKIKSDHQVSVEIQRVKKNKNRKYSGNKTPREEVESLIAQLRSQVLRTENNTTDPRETKRINQRIIIQEAVLQYLSLESDLHEKLDAQNHAHHDIVDLDQNWKRHEKDREQDIDDWKNGALVIDSNDPDCGKRISESRDRLELDRLEPWVYMNKKGDALAVLVTDPNGRVTVDREQYGQVTDIQIPPFKRLITPAHNGVEAFGRDYRDQQGMTWCNQKSSENSAQCYYAERDENRKILRDNEGNVRWQTKRMSNTPHWFVKPNNVNGRHRGYDKCTTVLTKFGYDERPPLSTITEEHSDFDSESSRYERFHNSGQFDSSFPCYDEKENDVFKQMPKQTDKVDAKSPVHKNLELMLAELKRQTETTHNLLDDMDKTKKDIKDWGDGASKSKKRKRS